MSSPRRLKVGVIGHVEHVTLGRVPAVPAPGDIAHLGDPVWFPGGGGGITFHQLVNSASEVHLFTAIGDDEAGAQVQARLRATGAVVHAAVRAQPHTRDVVMIDDAHERTIVVVGEPLHPEATDDLPWETLGALDAVYFTAQDPRLLEHARRSRILMATARRQHAIRTSGVTLDVVIGSHADPRERSGLADYAPAPGAVIMTEGRHGGVVKTAEGERRFAAPRVEVVDGGAYGAGDSFAGAVLHFLAMGHSPQQAAEAAGPYGAAVLRTRNPLDGQDRLP